MGREFARFVKMGSRKGQARRSGNVKIVFREEKKSESIIVMYKEKKIEICEVKRFRRK